MESESPWKTWVEVGRNRFYQITGGGVGTVVIDLIHDNKGTEVPEIFELGIEVGSKEEGGSKVMGTDSFRIPIALTGNN
ncbi:hypothetical protein D3C84_868210 [compost metagenome]